MQVHGRDGQKTQGPRVKRKIIIDTDPGQDDAVAILLALAAPDELDVLALVAVAGNVPLELTARNARQVAELAGRADLPVYAGCARPIRRTAVTAEHVHGKTGLDGPPLPEPGAALQAQHGVDFLIEALRAAPPGEITLCTLGPLTNVAMALVKAPDIAPRIREIVMMAGGFFTGGNVTPAAEFNVFADPEAADIVLKSGVPIVMLPLDVTHQVLTAKKRMERIKAIGRRCATWAHDMLVTYERFGRGKYGDGAPLHDPTVIAWLLKPDLFSGRSINVQIELAGQLTLGMTVADYWQKSGLEPNVLFLRDVDADGFFELLAERLGRLP
jgi:purine nucleosidase